MKGWIGGQATVVEHDLLAWAERKAFKIRPPALQRRSDPVLGKWRNRGEDDEKDGVIRDRIVCCVVEYASIQRPSTAKNASEIN